MLGCEDEQSFFRPKIWLKMPDPKWLYYPHTIALFVGVRKFLCGTDNRISFQIRSVLAFSPLISCTSFGTM